MPTAVPLPQDLGRFGYNTELSFKGTAGSNKNPKNVLSLDPKPARAKVERSQQRNSTKDGYGPKIGNQSYELSIETLCSDQSAADVGDIIKTSLGEEVAASSPALAFASGTQNDVTKSAGTFDDIIKVVGSDALTYYRPIKSVATNTATFAIKLPVGVTATSCVNAEAAGGRAFRDKADGTVDTYQLLVDQAGYTGERNIKGQGAVPNPFKIVWNLEQLLKFQFSFKSAVWSISTSSSGLTDANDSSHGYLSDCVSFGIQSLGTPAVLTELGLKAFDVTLGYDFIPGKAGVGASGGTLPGSNVQRFIRGNPNEDTVKVTIDDGDWKTWDDAVTAGTKYQLWAEFQPGNMGASAQASRICLWLPQLLIVSAAPTKVDGVQCTMLEFAKERSTSPSLRRSYLSFFVS